MGTKRKHDFEPYWQLSKDRVQSDTVDFDSFVFAPS